MENLHSKSDLQKQSVHDVIDAYKTLYEWTNATNFNDDGLPKDSLIAAFFLAVGMQYSISKYLLVTSIEVLGTVVNSN